MVRGYSTIRAKFSPSTDSPSFFCKDHLYHHQGNHPGRARLVHGGLPGSQEGVPRPGRWFVFFSPDRWKVLEFVLAFAGFDLVGPEDTTKPIIDYLVPLLRFKDRQKELGLDIPFIFHAGETLGDGTAADDNLYDAILLGTKRIGHG